MTALASIEAVKLRSGYDVELLARDVANVSNTSWGDKTRYHSKNGRPAAGRSSHGWTCLPLRSPGGDLSRTDPGGPGTVEFAYTSVFEHVPYIRTILDEVPGNHRVIALLALAPGASSYEHRDYPSGFPYGWIRLHIPIITNEWCSTTINGKRYHWQAGDLWYGDFSQLHMVANEGDTTRVHLVMDVEVTPQVVQIFPDSFIATLKKDQILYNTPEISLPDKHGFNCVFTVHAGECLFADEPWTSSPEDSCVVTISAGRYGRLDLSTTDGVQATLVHTGGNTFRYLGWTDAHSLTIGTEPGMPPIVTWRFQEGAKTLAEHKIIGRRPCHTHSE